MQEDINLSDVELRQHFKKWWVTAPKFEKERLKTTNKVYGFKDGLFMAWVCSPFIIEYFKNGPRF